MKLKYNILFHSVIATVVVTLTLMLSYFLLGAIPQFFGLKLTDYYINTVYAISALLFIPITIYFVKKWDINIKQFFVKLPKWYEIIVILLVAVVFYFASILIIDSLEDIIAIFDGKINTIFIRNIPNKYAYIIRVFHAAIIAPIVEEVFFRGLILLLLLRKFSVFKAIIISSLLFAFGHLRFDDFIYLFFSGIVFALIFYKTGSLYISILAHSFNNLIISFIDTKKISINSISGSHIALIMIGFVFIIATVCMLLKVPRNKIDHV